MTGSDPYIAALLSLFLPGAGQWYLRQTRKGAALLLIAVALWFAIPLAAWAFNVLAALDACQLAARASNGQPVREWDWFWQK